MKLALIQMPLTWEQPEINLTCAGGLISDAVKGGATLVILPEMFICGFCAPVGSVAREYYVAGQEFLKTQAVANKIWIAGSLPALLPDWQLPTNRLSLFAPSGEQKFYDKNHLFVLSDEAARYNAGSNGGMTADIAGMRTSFSICYDLRFPYLYWNKAQFTDLFVVVANWPAVRTAHWRALLIARAIENQCYVVGVNIVGESGGFQYSGNSLVVGPDGAVLLDCEDKTGAFLAEIDAGIVDAQRKKFPFMRSRLE